MANGKNNIFQLSKKFDDRKKPKTQYTTTLYGRTFDIANVEGLLIDLKEIKKRWSGISTIGTRCLVSAYCYDVVSKSNRISELFKFDGNNANELLVGARFADKKINDKYGHIFTYCFDKRYIDDAIMKLHNFINAFRSLIGNSIEKGKVEDIKKAISPASFSKLNINKASFFNLIHELSYIKNFGVFEYEDDIYEPTTVTFFDTGLDLYDVINQCGVKVFRNNINDNSAYLDSEQYQKLKLVAPYLISMAVTDFAEYENDNIRVEKAIDNNYKDFPAPSNEPVIGVIDTLFDQNVYFSDWVDYTRVLSNDIPSTVEDMQHGTAVDSLIVDLPNLNPDLDDSCGRFRVRHFGVTLRRGGVSTFTLMKQIVSIVESNKDIHVWNLSLGSPKEVSLNFISPEASVLDQLQARFPDVIFVVSGTNLEAYEKQGKRIGSPADSINSVVVNSVKRGSLEKVSYARRGPVLSFFIKPDLSYYGGDVDDPIVVAGPYDNYKTYGTSFAAPMIARKLAYMIEVLKIPRCCAKALLIDSCIGWGRKFKLEDSNYIGRGIPPININDIIKTDADEIRVYISGESKDYYTDEYNFPVPLDKNLKYPYYARATLCYFPTCRRNQGVDYTDTELRLKFGRTKIDADNGNFIKSINNDFQDQEGYFIRENNARDFYRKWDNTKVLSETVKNRAVPKKRFDRDNWGFELTYIDRQSSVKVPVRWGLVITLKAMDGKNRIEDFKHACQLNNWFINEVITEEKVTAYIKAQEDVIFK